MSKGTNILEAIDEFLNNAAVTKAAESSNQGVVENQGDSGTSHPSKSTEDGTQDAPEGARSAENSSDVKGSITSQSVDEAKEDKMSGKSENELTTAKPTGEDPSNETASVNSKIPGEAGKDHKGQDTSHPAKVDFGDKYASVKQAAEDIISRANDAFAKIAALEDNDAPATKQAKITSASTGGSETDEDEAAGAKAAEAVVAELNKQANEGSQELLVHIVKSAYDDANDLADFYAGMQHAGQDVTKQANARTNASLLHLAIKKAMDDESAGADDLAFGEGEESAGGNEAPPADPGAMEGGPAPEAGMGGDEEALAQIVALLEQNGIDPEVLAQINPEDLAQALMEMQGGAGGEMPAGEAMDAAPEEAPEAALMPGGGADEAAAPVM